MFKTRRMFIFALSIVLSALCACTIPGDNPGATTAPAQEASPAPAPEVQVDTEKHMLPDPDQIFVFMDNGNDVVQILPQSEGYEELVRLANARIARPLEMTRLTLDEQTRGDLSPLINRALCVLFLYDLPQSQQYLYTNGMEFTLGFQRVLLPLEQTEEYPQGDRMIFFGDGEIYYDEPSAVDASQELTDYVKNMAAQWADELQ